MTESTFRANPNLKKSGIAVEYTQEWIEEYVKCAKSPIYFINKYFKTVNLDRGLIQIDLYPFQKEMIQIFHDNKMSILKLPRQSSKTTTTVAYMLWASIFNDNYGIAVLANKASIAREILDRYQLAYENLPPQLQQGVKKFNEGSVELENGTRIFATATSVSAIRGFSVNLLFCDEAAHISNNIMEEFFSSVYPTLSSGKNTKFILSSTPKGLNLFYKFWTDAKAGRNAFVPYEIHWSQVPGRDEAWEKEQRAVLGVKFDQEFNCAFLGSTNTLISSEKLGSFVYKDPINEFCEMKIYKEPVKEIYDTEKNEFIQKDHIYVLCVDVSEGRNLDYSVFSVFDISTMPYEQVAVYRNNAIPPMLYPSVIKTCAEYYNDAFVLVEVNNNPQVAALLLEDLEYENVIQVTTGKNKGQAAILGGGMNCYNGLKMSAITKRIGCSTAKTLLENDKLIINDFETISELTTFVASGTSFTAEEGCHDDLVISLVIFGWFATQNLFKEIVEHDIRKQLQKEHFDWNDDEQLPTGQVTSGLEIEHFIEDNSVWIETRKADCYGDFLRQLLDS